MFKRVFSVVMASILIVTVILSAVCYTSLRNSRINSRLDTLKADAREVAYLAAQTGTMNSMYSLFFDRDSSWMSYLRRKTTQINQEYGAYIVVVDRSGRMMDNHDVAWQEDPAFMESLNGEEISSGLSKVLGGEEISLRTMVDGDPTFTVGVPFKQSGYVLGAVFIQTKAQIIEDGTADMLRMVIIVALTVLAASALALYLIMKRLLRPLGELTAAAGRMANGEFDVQVVEGRGKTEVAELTHAFNIMSGKLRETEKVRRDFVANVSHELKSPITSISGFVEGILDGTVPQEEQQSCLTIVAGETKRLTRLINDLLALSRLEKDDAALDKTEFDICEMLRCGVIRRMNDLESRRIEIDCRFDSESMKVLADRDRIEQVIINLMDNAIKFTPDGGTITLASRNSVGKVRVTVADNGLTIAPEDRERIFERFYTVDKAHTSGKGTGLGLSICQRILQMHGEPLTLDDVSEGASFSFTLPIAQKT